MTTRAFFKVCLVLIFLNTIVEKHTLNPEITLLYQFHAHKALLKVPKTCNINLWIEKGGPPLRKFTEISSSHPSLTVLPKHDIDTHTPAWVCSPFFLNTVKIAISRPEFYFLSKFPSLLPQGFFLVKISCKYERGRLKINQVNSRSFVNYLKTRESGQIPSEMVVAPRWSAKKHI